MSKQTKKKDVKKVKVMNPEYVKGQKKIYKALGIAFISLTVIGWILSILSYFDKI